MNDVATRDGIDAISESMTAIRIDWKRLGEDVRSERIRRGLTRRQFAAMTGVAPGVLEGLEASYKPCNVETFMTLSTVIDRNPSDYAVKRIRDELPAISGSVGGGNA